MIVSYRVIAWMPLIAVLFHLVEEFVWPGGFKEWYRAFRPERASSVTTQFLVYINAVLILIAVLAGMLGSRTYGVAFWLIVASIGACNAGWHAWATIVRNDYSPGVVTACVLYIPLAIFGFVHFSRSGIVPPHVVIQAAVVGPAFLFFSAWNHRRRARSSEPGAR
jgi:hypothetical protein